MFLFSSCLLRKKVVFIYVFFLISGNFMLNSKVKWDKVARLIFQIFSINLIACRFLTSIRCSYGVKDCLKMIPFVFDVSMSFITSYIIVYRFSSVINKAIKSFNQREYSYLLLMSLIYFIHL